MDHPLPSEGAQRAEVAELMERHEDLIAAARGLGSLLAHPQVQEGADLDELEEAAGHLESAALGYARARRALGPCRWELGDLLVGEGQGGEEFREASAALYEAAEALGELSQDGPPAAVEAVR